MIFENYFPKKKKKKKLSINRKTDTYNQSFKETF